MSDYENTYEWLNQLTGFAATDPTSVGPWNILNAIKSVVYELHAENQELRQQVAEMSEVLSDQRLRSAMQSSSLAGLYIRLGLDPTEGAQ